MMKELVVLCGLSLYRLGASLVSVFGIAEFAIESRTAALEGSCPQTDGSDLGVWIYGYLVVRLMLGISQLPLHLGCLCPARLNDRAATFVTRQFLGSGDMRRGVDKFYQFVGVCNVCLGLAILVSGYFVNAMTQCMGVAELGSATPHTNSIRALEISSMAVLAYVLGLRIGAAVLGKTRAWFQLAWPPEFIESPEPHPVPDPDAAAHHPTAPILAAQP